MKLTFTPKLIKCRTCESIKSETEFYRQSITGIPYSDCKQCHNIKRQVVKNKFRQGKFISSEKRRNMTDDIEHTIDDWADAMIHFVGCCAFCGIKNGKGKATRLERDHLVPISKGGKTERKNIVPACRKCNRGRGNKDWQEWFAEQSFFTRAQAERIEAWNFQV